MGITNFSGIVDTPPSIEPIFCQFEFHNILTIDMLIIVFTFLFIDMFDTMGTLVGVCTKAGMMQKDGRIPGLNKAFMADAIATMTGACLGASTTTTYVESASGVAQGGRTGLTAFSTAICFAIALFFAPIFLSIPSAATTPVLVIVGLFMLGEATFATGFAQRVATSIINKAGASETRLLVFSILLIAFMSAFLNNAGVTAITLPMLISIARKAHLSPSRILLPTAYAASFGGCISLVGQAPSMVANGILAKMAPEYGQFAFFEFAWFGLPLTLLAALLFGLFPRFLVPPAREDVAELKEIETPEGGIHMWIAGGIYFLVIICMATGLVPLTSAAMLGAMLCVITRCMTLKQAQAGIDWTTVWLFAGMLSMSFAMNKSGAAQLIADFVVSYFSDPYILFGVLMLVTGILTNIMSNTATTAIMVPLVIPIALGMNLSPLPFVMGIAMSAAACYMTPIATPSNTLVLRPGNYTFGDYVRYGFFWQVLSFALAVLIIPSVWPFMP